MGNNIFEGVNLTSSTKLKLRNFEHQKVGAATIASTWVYIFIARLLRVDLYISSRRGLAALLILIDGQRRLEFGMSKRTDPTSFLYT